MRKIISPADSKSLLPSELSVAKKICEEAIASVESRYQYIEDNCIDRSFALPDANWSHKADNEYNNLYRRIAKGDKSDLENLRGFVQVFSGYSLYDVRSGQGLRPSTMIITDQTPHLVEAKLIEKNKDFVDEWLAMINNLPKKYVFKPPMLFGECGDLIDDIIVNNDTLAYQERANLVYEFGLAEWIENKIKSTGKVRVLEIGGGYGALAYWFNQVFPHCSYTICDLPESLLFSRLYLTLSMPNVKTSFGLAPLDHGFRFLPNYMVEKIEESFDLVINTLSFSEMSLHQVNKYAHLIKNKFIGCEGLFFEQNQDNKYMELLCAQDIFAEHFQYRVNFSHVTGKMLNGMPNVWANHEITLEPKPIFCGVKKQNIKLLEDLGVFNLVQVDDGYFCLRKSLRKVDLRILAKRDAPPDIFFGYSPEAVKRSIRELNQNIKLLEDLGVFNLVQVDDGYFCLRKSLGKVDLRILARRDAPPDIFFGYSPEAVKQSIRELSVVVPT